MSTSKVGPGQSRKRKRAAKGGNGGGSSRTSGSPKEMVDYQSDMGNEALKDATQEQEKPTAGSKDFHLTSSVRWAVLADTEIQKVAAAVYAEAQNTGEVDEEKLALAAATFNQSEAVRLDPAEREYFGAANLDYLLENEEMFENYRGSRFSNFHNEVAFGQGFETEEDVKAAEAAIKAATEIVTVGSPLSRDYMVFSREGVCPTPDRVDPASRIQYGMFTFWAFDPEKGPQTNAPAQEEQGPDVGMLATAAASAAPPKG